METGVTLFLEDKFQRGIQDGVSHVITFAAISKIPAAPSPISAELSPIPAELSPIPEENDGREVADSALPIVVDSLNIITHC